LRPRAIAFRRGLEIVLAQEEDIQVVGEAGDGAAAVALARAKRPVVMLLDVRMPRQDGVTAAGEIAQNLHLQERVQNTVWQPDA
jgi:DNA-binding NarL/FixJ family response regulator